MEVSDEIATTADGSFVTASDSNDPVFHPHSLESGLLPAERLRDVAPLMQYYVRHRDEMRLFDAGELELPSMAPGGEREGK